MMIPASYISTFLPVQDLDELTSSTEIVPLSSDDLFLISQISAYATNSQNAVAVSKKLRYGNLKNKLSADFDIYNMTNNITNMSTDIRELSIYTHHSVDFLSDTIDISVQKLIDYSDYLNASLSNEVSSNYIKKYSQDVGLIYTEDNKWKITTSAHIENGKVTTQTTRDLTSLLTPTDWITTAGAIGPSTYTSFDAHTENNDRYEYQIRNDCYFNCSLSVKEYDSYNPLQMWIKTADGSLNVLYKTFNNPGGFSGTDFTNYYNVSVPLKHSIDGKNIVVYFTYTTAIPIYADIHIDEYKFYSVPSEDDIAGCAKKASPPINPIITSPSVCKIAVNSEGIVTKAESVYYGRATPTQLGLIKISEEVTQNGPTYGIQLSDNYISYVTIPRANSEKYGTIRLASNASAPASCHGHAYGNVLYNTDLSHFLSCSLEQNDGYAQTFIPCATNDTFGVVKLSSCNESYSFDLDGSDPLSTYLNIDLSGHAFVKVPIAKRIDNISYPGLVKTGVPDTSEIRVVRSIYVDTDGVAKVNVANQIGVGLFHVDTPNSGYTKCVSIDLDSSSSMPINEFSTTYTISAFTGETRSPGNYGSFAFVATSQINGWFMAQLVVEGMSKDYLNEDTSLQIVCDGILVTTVNPKYIQNTTGKRFTYSTYLGVFRGSLFNNDNISSNRLFAVLTSKSSFNTDLNVYFLIKETNPND